MSRFADGCFLFLFAAILTPAQDGPPPSSPNVISQSSPLPHLTSEAKSASGSLSDSFDGVRADYIRHIRTNYSFPFGKNLPFSPSNVQIEGNDFIQAGAFPTAEYCGHCHRATYEQCHRTIRCHELSVIARKKRPPARHKPAEGSRTQCPNSSENRRTRVRSYRCSRAPLSFKAPICHGCAALVS